MQDASPFIHLIEPREKRSMAQSGLNPVQLSAYQRALLILDGTVTQFIEAYAGEPVDVIRLYQGFQRLPAAHAWLQTDADTEVITREVILQGHLSETLYVHASSLLVVSRIPAKLAALLETDAGGIGRILLGSQIENRRELLWFGRERMARIPPCLPPHTDNDFLSRYYRVMISGRPVMLINEKFPAQLQYPAARQPG